MTKAYFTSKKDHPPSQRERRACEEIIRLLPAMDLANATYAHALDVFGDLNKKIGDRPLKNWKVELKHLNGSRFLFKGALLVECDGWLGCFSQECGFHVYHASDLKQYECTALFYNRSPKEKGPVTDGQAATR